MWLYGLQRGLTIKWNDHRPITDEINEYTSACSRVTVRYWHFTVRMHEFEGWQEKPPMIVKIFVMVKKRRGSKREIKRNDEEIYG